MCSLPLLFLIFCFFTQLIQANQVVSCTNDPATGDLPFFCDYKDKEGDVCAYMDSDYPDPSKQDGFMVMAAIVGAMMAFGIGSNDAANSWATSVGSGAIQLKYAVLLGGIFEWFGAATLGYGVSSSISKGVANIDDPLCWACGYCNSNMGLYQGGMFAALLGASCFLLLASSTSLPVSTTHAIVGGVVGVTVAGVGGSCLNWDFDGGLGGIVLSWVISPIFSGLVAVMSYAISDSIIIHGPGNNQFERSLIALPLLYFVATFAILFLGMLKAKAIKELLSLSQKVFFAFIISSLVAIPVWFFVVPRVKKEVEGVEEKINEQERKNPSLTTKGANVEMSRKGAPEWYNAFDQSVKTKVEKILLKLEKRSPEMKSQIAEKTGRSTEEVDELINWWMNEHAGKIENSATADDADVEKNIVGNFEDFVNTDNDVEIEIPEEEFKFGVVNACRIFTRERGYTIEQAKAIYTFRYLLVLCACLESIAHGSNDTANATGAFTAVLQSYETGFTGCDKSDSPVWVMVVAGFFVFLGINTYGYNVIRTIGSELVDIDFHRGFFIEFGSTMATITATVLEFPVSTTHCQIGAVVFVGLYAVGKKNVSWGLFGKIIVSWVITLPIAGGIAAIFTAIFKVVL